MRASSSEYHFKFESFTKPSTFTVLLIRSKNKQTEFRLNFEHLRPEITSNLSERHAMR